jgi:hypothetical protein
VQPAALGLDAPLVDAGGGRVTVGVRGVLIAGAATDALVATRAEGPSLRRRGGAGARAGAVAGEEHDADVGGATGVVKGLVELVDGVRAEGVQHLRPVEGDPHDATGRPHRGGAVVGDVGERESGHLGPGRGVEGVADVGKAAHAERA